MTLLQIFGKRLKQERELRELTIAEFAFLCNVSSEHFRNVELGRINPKLELIEGIIKQGVDIKTMFEEIDDGVVTGMILRKSDNNKTK